LTVDTASSSAVKPDAHDLDELAADLDVATRVGAVVQQDGGPRVGEDVPVLLPAGLGADQDVRLVGVGPDDACLGLAVGPPSAPTR
jgi:hypothetical protein